MTNDTLQKSNWIQTVSGKVFYPLEPWVADVDILDIAHALSNQCRFSGHTRMFYSVAQHSVLVSDYLKDKSVDVQLWGLLHDAAEAYMVDVPRPIKAAIPQIREIEDNILRTIMRRFTLPEEMPYEVREADNSILFDERDALLEPTEKDWDFVCKPLGISILPWTSQSSKSLFLDKFTTLMNQR